jgi:hypothetical protein
MLEGEWIWLGANHDHSALLKAKWFDVILFVEKWWMMMRL